MIWIAALIGFAAGALLGAGVTFLAKRRSELERREELEALREQMKESFGSLSLETLGRLTEEFSRFATEKLTAQQEIGVRDLDERKKLIDQQLLKMNDELVKVTSLMRELEKDRAGKFGELSSSLKNVAERTAALTETTDSLRLALANTRARGQWGERMAEDILRMAGFIEGVNYLKQQTTDVGTRPDFTFMMPRDLKLNMDVKFPLDNYLRFLDAEGAGEKDGLCKAFLSDVKTRIKEVTGREYIDPQQNTVDCALLFIPNEQIYSFIYEKDCAIIDYGIENRVLLCSPITLIAILAVIRQAVDYFSLEQTSNEILALLGDFNKQWGMFKEKMDKLGKQLGTVQKSYDDLASTRSNQLEKPLGKIGDLRSRKMFSEPSDPAGGSRDGGGDRLLEEAGDGETGYNEDSVGEDGSRSLRGEEPGGSGGDDNEADDAGVGQVIEHEPDDWQG